VLDLHSAGAAVGVSELIDLRLRRDLPQRSLFPRRFLVGCRAFFVPATESVLGCILAAPCPAAIEPIMRGALTVYAQLVAPPGGHALEAFDSDIGLAGFVLIVLDYK
jgi:hypothetical protein